MQVLKGSILNVTEGIIAHQVNCMGVAGAGLALQIANAYPLWKQDYIAYCNKHGRNPANLLGMVHLYHVGNVTIASIFGQKVPGRGVMTDDRALGLGLSKLGKYSLEKGRPLYLPYGIGCGLAGGNWRTVSALIEVGCPHAVLVKL